jgi:membrane-associated protease RseP (regulator of RpoE activity)
MRHKQFVLISIGILMLVFSSIGALGAYAMSKDETPAPQHQEGERGYLGITAEDTDDGVVVRTIERRSGAQEAGVERGDIITAVDSETVETVDQLRELIEAKSAGDIIILTVQRDEESIDLEVTLGSRRAQVEILQGPSIEVSPPLPPQVNGPFNADRYQLGVGYQSLTPTIAENEALSVDEGALVTSVVEESPAADAGLQEGDIIVAVDGDTVDIEHTLSDRLYAYEAEDHVSLTVLREGETLEIGVVLASDHPDKVFGQGHSFGGRSIAIQVDPENPISVPFDIERIPYEIELSPFGDNFDPFNGEFVPFDGELHFDGGTFSFPEFDVPEGVVPTNILTLSCTNGDGSSFNMSLTLPLSIEGEITDELPDNVVESLEDAGYECEISTAPFDSRSNIEANENL